jgi:hypothetical protein
LSVLFACKGTKKRAKSKIIYAFPSESTFLRSKDAQAQAERRQSKVFIFHSGGIAGVRISERKAKFIYAFPSESVFMCSKDAHTQSPQRC